MALRLRLLLLRLRLLTLLLRLAADLVIDAIVEPEDLRRELVARLGLAMGKPRAFTERHNGIPPV